MTVQCMVCRKIRDNGKYRLPWPGELPENVSKTYCPNCAKEALSALQRGELPLSYTRTNLRKAAS